jgi:acetyl esterase
MSAHSFTPVLEPKTQAFIDSLDAAGGPPLYTLTPDAARAVLADAQAAPVEKLPADIEDTTFPVGPTGSVKIRIVRPQDGRARCPSYSTSMEAGGSWATAIRMTG